MLNYINKDVTTRTLLEKQSTSTETLNYAIPTTHSALPKRQTFSTGSFHDSKCCHIIHHTEQSDIIRQNSPIALQLHVLNGFR